MYCSTPENCYSSCNVLESIASKVSARLEAVRSNQVDMEAEAEAARLSQSSLTPDDVPSWCNDDDDNCAAYGVTICSTSEVSICAAYCGCPVATNTDFDASESKSGDNGAALPPKDSTTTVIAVVVVILLLVIVGAAVYVKTSSGGGSGANEEGVVAFDNPAYATGNGDGGGGGYVEPQGSSAPNQETGYMDVGPLGTAQSQSSGYMDVNPHGAAAAAGGGFDQTYASSDEEV